MTLISWVVTRIRCDTPRNMILVTSVLNSHIGLIFTYKRDLLGAGAGWEGFGVSWDQHGDRFVEFTKGMKVANRWSAEVTEGAAVNGATSAVVPEARIYPVDSRPRMFTDQALLNIYSAFLEPNEEKSSKVTFSSRLKTMLKNFLHNFEKVQKTTFWSPKM